MIKFNIVRRNSTVCDVIKFFERLPMHYNMYRDKKFVGCWKFAVSKTNDCALKIKQMNTTYDPKGYKYEYLIIHVNLLQQGDDVLIKCKARWSWSIIGGILLLLCSGCTSLCVGLLYIHKVSNKAGVILILCSILILFTVLYFLCSYKNQVRLAKSVFAKLVDSRS